MKCKYCLSKQLYQMLSWSFSDAHLYCCIDCGKVTMYDKNDKPVLKLEEKA